MDDALTDMGDSGRYAAATGGGRAAQRSVRSIQDPLSARGCGDEGWARHGRRGRVPATSVTVTTSWWTRFRDGGGDVGRYKRVELTCVLAVPALHVVCGGDLRVVGRGDGPPVCVCESRW